jgi:hypothetical protein
MPTGCTKAKNKITHCHLLCRLIDFLPTYQKNLLPPSSGQKSKSSVEIKYYGHREREEPAWGCKRTNGTKEKGIQIIGP